MGSSISKGYENKLDMVAKVSLEHEKKLKEAFGLLNRELLINWPNPTGKGILSQISSSGLKYHPVHNSFGEKTDEQIEDEIQFHLEKIKDLKTVLGNKRKKYKKRNLKSLQGLKK